MEVKHDLHSYIFVLDNVMPKKILKSFTRYCKSLNYQKAKVIGKKEDVLNENIRKTLSYHLFDIGAKSLTDVHWSNFLNYTFSFFINDYKNFFKLDLKAKVNDIQLLKYEKNGQYKFHVDDCPEIHRTLSCIFLVNDDYEGGDLVFGYKNSDKQTCIEKKKNRMVIWPSNFLFPHAVKPVIEGERYSVVSWAL